MLTHDELPLINTNLLVNQHCYSLDLVIIIINYLVHHNLDNLDRGLGRMIDRATPDPESAGSRYGLL